MNALKAKTASARFAGGVERVSVVCRRALRRQGRREHPPRQVPYFDSFRSLDEGWMDDLCTEMRGDVDQLAGQHDPIADRHESKTADFPTIY